MPRVPGRPETRRDLFDATEIATVVTMTVVVYSLINCDIIPVSINVLQAYFSEFMHWHVVRTKSASQVLTATETRSIFYFSIAKGARNCLSFRLTLS